jgi:hypothetical protein
MTFGKLGNWGYNKMKVNRTLIKLQAKEKTAILCWQMFWDKQ